ncbi:MAG: hypothetical protein JWO80_2304 [Bryobacterales bacterium]|nr:hypothetical protein [Bryobacterales bacterium]
MKPLRYATASGHDVLQNLSEEESRAGRNGAVADLTGFMAGGEV